MLLSRSSLSISTSAEIVAFGAAFAVLVPILFEPRRGWQNVQLVFDPVNKLGLKDEQTPTSRNEEPNAGSVGQESEKVRLDGHQSRTRIQKIGDKHRRRER